MPNPKRSVDVHPTTAMKTNIGARGRQAMETRIGKQVTIDTMGCWIYGKDPMRRPRVLRDGQAPYESISPHRFVYESLVGDIPDGYHLHHMCEKPACCNPDHMMVVTPSEHAEQHLRLNYIRQGP